jgi:hypothetical protein
MGFRTVDRRGLHPGASAFALRNRIVALREEIVGDGLLLAAILLGLAIRIVYWAVTAHRFEDALITVTHARNVNLGLGLTHHPGEGHVHGFTSAISVLVPTAAEVVHLGTGFTALRLTTLAATVFTMIFAVRITKMLPIARWATAILLAYLALDYNNVLYGMAGMETQIAVAVLLASLYYLMTENRVKLGIALGVCLLTRPDFILFVVPALAFLWSVNRARAIRAGAIAALVVLPWIVFTTAYYGSPVPQTIKAKQQSYTEHPPIGHTPASVVHFVDAQLHQHGDQWRYLAPFKENFAVVKAPIDDVWLLFLAIGILALAVVGLWVTRRNRLWLAGPVYVAAFAAYKLLLLPPTYYEWYLPPFMAVLLILVAAGLTRLRLEMPRFAPALALVLVALWVWQIAAMIPIDRRVQEIENHVRTNVGLFLRANVRPGEALTSESAGYIGFYSHAKLYDYPGLTSPTAYKTLKRLGKNRNSLLALIDALRPRWIVLRPTELEGLRSSYPRTAAVYAPVQRFTYSPSWATPAPPGLTIKSLGVTYYDGDADFTVLRRS